MWYLKSRSFQTNLNFLHWKLEQPPQGHFFLLFSAAAPVTPFLPILAKQLGISPFGVGIVFAGTKFQVFSLGLYPNAPLQYSAALWRNGWQAHCRLAGWLSWTTTDSFPSCTPPFRFLLSEIPLHNIPVNFRFNFWLYLCRPFLLQYPIGVLHQWRLHSSLWMFSTAITTEGVTLCR